MRLLSLVRHARSSWDHPELSDFERPLDARGRHDAPQMAERARVLLGVPDRLVSSPAARAIATARAFAEAMQLPEARLSLQPQIYEASDDRLLGLVRGLDDGDTHVMLFGHNPGFTDLAHRLAPCPFDDLPACAVVQIALEVRNWRDVADGGGRLRHYLQPQPSGD